MNKKTILVTAVSGDIGYSSVRSIDKNEFTIIGCDMSDSSPVREIMDGFYKSPAAYDVSYTAFLKTVIREKNVDFLLPISEPEIEAINTNREEIETTGVKILINNGFIINTFLDKLKTINYLKSIGVVVPKTVLLKEYERGFGFPVIVKAVKGCGSKASWKVDNQKDLNYLRYKEEVLLIVQEYIGSVEEEYTTGVFSDGKTVSSISFRRKLGKDGTTLEASLVKEKFLDRLSEKIAKEVNLKGSLNIQTRRVNDVFVPFEINPRISGTILFRQKFGFEDIKWWTNILLGNSYCYQPIYKAGKAIRYYSEYFFDMEKL